MLKFIFIILLNIYCHSIEIFTVTTKDVMRLDFNNLNINNIKFKINPNQRIFEIYNGSTLLKTIENVRFTKYTIINKNNELSYIELKISSD